MNAATMMLNDFTAQLNRAALADNTRIAYDKGWRCFVDFCSKRSIQPLSAKSENVVEFLVELAANPSPGRGRFLSLGTLALYRSAINKKFQDAGLASPTIDTKVDFVLKGLARLRPNSSRRVKALREGHIRAMLALCPNTVIGRRNAAILAIGFAAALRRSELCSLKVSDIEWVENPRGLIVHIRRSKTDQAGDGQQVAVPEGKKIRPRKLLESYLQVAGHEDGYLFRTMRRGGKITGNGLHHDDIARLVKKLTAGIGLDPSEFSAHSLRAGFVTCAAAHQARLDKIHGGDPAQEPGHGDEVHPRSRCLR